MISNVNTGKDIERESKSIEICKDCKCRKDNKIKDKTIDEMAKYIDSIDITEIFCQEKIICDEQCSKCIKEYFREKVENQ